MSISMNSVFSSGWKDIKKNPVLFVPTVLLFIFSMILLLAIGIVFFSVFPDGLNVLINSYSEFLVNEDFDLLMNSLSDFIWFFFLAIAIYVFFSVLLTVYVQAGLIGMSHDVSKTGETQLSKMFFYGNKYLFRSLFASILVSLIVLLPFFLFALLIIGGLIFLVLLSSGSALLYLLLLFVLILLLFFFMIIYLIYVIIVSLYLYFVLYAVVIDNLSVIGSIRKSIALFKANIVDVIIFCLIIMVISITVGVIASLLSSLSAIPVVGIIFSLLYLSLTILESFFLSVVIVVWGTRMYLALTENLIEKSDEATDKNDETAQEDEDW